MSTSVLLAFPSYETDAVLYRKHDHVHDGMITALE